MKGLSQLGRHDGQSAKEPCPICFAVLNETFKPGVPQLPVLPDEWASKDKRAAHIINPPLRGDSDSFDALAVSWAVEQAKKPETKLSGSGFHSITRKSMIEFSSPLRGFSGIPVHIDLGIGSVLLNKFEELCLAEDFKWSQGALLEQAGLVIKLTGLADQEVELSMDADDKRQAAQSLDIKLSALLESDPEAKARASKGGKLKASDVAANNYRAAKQAFETATAEANAVQTKLAAVQRSIETLKTELLNAKRGPLHSEFLDFCTEHGICRAAYFGGNTYVAPDLNEIFGSRTNIRSLALILKRRQAECPNGTMITLGSDERAATQEALLLSFLEVHKLFGRKEPLCEHEIAAFPELVSDFMCTFARVYPDVVPSPKMHMLGFHHKQLLDMKGSIGMDTEQGMEGYHPEVNYVQNLFRNHRDAVKQLKSARTAGKRSGAKGEDLREKKHARKEAARDGHKYKCK